MEKELETLIPGMLAYYTIYYTTVDNLILSVKKYRRCHLAELPRISLRAYLTRASSAEKLHS